MTGVSSADRMVRRQGAIIAPKRHTVALVAQSAPKGGPAAVVREIARPQPRPLTRVKVG